ncbi:MAG: hypothetical protein KME47_09965 [Nodosilinea sp. WJT8-NPBG4]|jgi:preprotein translocase subunit YajC|nr:hypothetical protein [Nodosilinea sp. WJT8-NPBG4]
MTINDIAVGDTVTLASGETAKVKDIQFLKVFIQKVKFGPVTSLNVNIKDQTIQGLA